MLPCNMVLHEKRTSCYPDVWSWVLNISCPPAWQKYDIGILLPCDDIMHMLEIVPLPFRANILYTNTSKKKTQISKLVSRTRPHFIPRQSPYLYEKQKDGLLNILDVENVISLSWFYVVCSVHFGIYMVHEVAISDDFSDGEAFGMRRKVFRNWLWPVTRYVKRALHTKRP